MRLTIRNFSFNALMVVQFLGAFTDNLFKITVSMLALRLIPSAGMQATYVGIVGAIFIIPFILFSSYAGYLADRFPKQRIILWTKLFEIAIMILAYFALVSHNLVFITFILFLMACQSAVFGPSKYGILPEILKEEELSRGNGYIQLWTFLAIILGTACGGQFMSLWGNTIENIAFILIGCSIVGGVASLFILNEAPVAKPVFELNFLKQITRYFLTIKKNTWLFLTLIAIAYFWFFASIVQMNTVLYGRNSLNLSEFQTSILIVFAAIGLAIGSLCAGRLSDEKVEVGLIPLGALGMSIASLFLGYHGNITLAFICYFILGCSAGFYIVPLNAFFQQATPQAERGQYISVLNVSNALMMLAASAFMWLTGGRLEFSPAQIFAMLGFISVAVAIYIVRTIPDMLLRLFNWLLTHSLYKIQVINRVHVPKQGGALLVSNHVSFIDPLLILASLQRPVRFLALREIYNVPWIKPFMKLMRTIPVSPKDSPKEILKALNTAKEAIKQGELVCIFAEGSLTRTGNMLPFQKGFEFIMKDLDAPIIPLCLDSLWGSIFTYEGGKFFWKWPKVTPYCVTLYYGNPMPSESKIYQVRLAVQEITAEAFRLRGRFQEKLQMAFIREAKKRPFKFCLADSTGLEVNYAQALGMVMLISRRLFPEDTDPASEAEMVGIMLPPSVIATMANGAALCAGKIPVNLNFTASKESLDSSIAQCHMKRILTARKFIEKLQIPPDDKMIFIEELLGKISKWEKIKYVLLAVLLPKFIIQTVFVKGDKTNIDDVATVIFSSGSTGEPKGVMLTHGNIFSNIQGFYQVANVQASDVIMGVLPFFHSFGFTAGLCFPVGTGLSAVYHYNPLDAGTIGKLVEKYKATVILGTPTFFSAYTRKCTKEQFKTIRYAVAGAEKLQLKVVEAFNEKFGIKPYEGYGATELSPIVSINVPDVQVNESDYFQVGNKLGKVGHPIPGVAAKVVNPDTFETMPFNDSGLLLIKGPNVMKGYLGHPEKTSEVIKDGWYVTGDIATIDEDGFIHITDRLSRFSKIGGEMVPHIKVEEEVINAVSFSDFACAVTAVPDEKKGESLVVLYKGEIDIDKVCQVMSEKGMPNLWIPKKENFVAVENIPLLGSGKKDLRKIKELANEQIRARGNV